MKLTDAYRLVKGAIKTNTAVMLWGPPGIGKSDIIFQIAHELYPTTAEPVLDFRLAQVEPTDLRGVPMPNHTTGRSDWYLPGFWPDRAVKATTRVIETAEGLGTTVPVKAGCCPKGPGILFLDEIEKAPISVKNASLQLVLNRKVGTYKLPDDWAIVCAGNNPEDACFSQDLGAALANRMIHLSIEPDVATWAAWARDNHIQEDIIGFLYLRPDFLYKQTEEHAFPSPRSWAIASNLISTVSTRKEQEELLSASVGKAVKQEFVVWQNVYKSVDPEAIFHGVMPDPERFNAKDNQSFRYAVSLAFAFHLRKRKEGIAGAEEHIVKFLKMLSPELRTLALQQVSNGRNLYILESMAAHPAFKCLIKDVYAICT